VALSAIAGSIACSLFILGDAVAHLGRPLQALKHALDTLPKQARRLARWHARRDFMLCQKLPARPMRLSPFRPGSPPGFRLRAIHEVDGILRESHALALDALDTS
jgi:hypothetical protein